MGEKAQTGGDGEVEDQASESRFFRCFQIFNRVTAVVVGLLALASTLSSALTDWPVGPIAGTLLGISSALLLGFHWVNLELRIFLRHWTIEEIRRPLIAELALGIGISYAVLIAIIYLPPTWQMLTCVGVALLAAYACYEPVEQTIRKEVKREGFWQGTYYFGNLTPLVFLGIDDEIKVMAETRHGPNLQSLLGFFLGPSWITGLSRTRTVVLCMMMGCFLVSFAAAADVGVQEAIRNKERGQLEKEVTPKPSPEELGGSGGGGGGDEAQEEEALASGGECTYLPGYGAPAWARATLNALYIGGKELDATPPPGFDIGGCTNGAVVPPGLEGTFAYAVGKDPAGEVKSVGLVSVELGPAMFLAPSAQRVLALIDNGLTPLGGYPKVDAAGGDLVTVLTTEGTRVLVRAAKHPPGKARFAVPYVQLPAPVATAWVGAMQEIDAWLWPLAPVYENGEEIFSLVGHDRGGEVRLEVTYEPETGVAERDGYVYDLPEPQLSQQELEHWAALATAP